MGADGAGHCDVLAAVSVDAVRVAAGRGVVVSGGCAADRVSGECGTEWNFRGI